MIKIAGSKLNKDQMDGLNAKVESLQELNDQYAEFIKMQTDTGGIISQSSTTSLLQDPSRIKTMFRDTNSNVSNIANAMIELWKTNGIINGTVRYLQSHLTYNHSIYPSMNVNSGYEMQKDNTEYFEVANSIERYNIKYYAPYFLQQMLLKGVVYLYEYSDKNNIGYMEFPTAWCRVRMMDSNLLRWELDMSQVKETSEMLPREVQQAYTQYNSGGTPTGNRWVDGKWFLLSDKAFALALDHSVMSSGVGISEFANLLLDSSMLENAKNNIEVKDELDTVKIIHSKIPTDNQGNLKLSAKLATQYDRKINRALPTGIVGITSPMEMNNVTITGAGDKGVYQMVEKAQEQLFLSTGTPANLFGKVASSSKIVELSIHKDTFWLYTKVLPVLENYYNYRLKKFKTQSSMEWKMKFIRQSYFTLDKDITRMQQQLDRGGSRLDYLASTGMSPAEIVNKLKMEQEMLNIDSIMLPKQTSHTMSSKSSESTNGRPVSDDPSEVTERISETE